MHSTIPTALLPAAGLIGTHQHRGPAWRPFPLLPEGDDHAADAADGDDGDDEADDGDDDGADDKGGADDGADKLGDAGKKALDRMKQQRNEAKAELRKFKALGLTPEQIAQLTKGKGGKADDGDGDKPDAEAIREEARAQARQEVLRERVLDKIEAKAGNRFSVDAEDVAAMLLRRHDVDDFLDGSKVDTEAITEALDDLLKKSPNLAAQGGRRFQGGGDQGPRKGGGKPQLTRDDIKKLSPDQILKAQAAGQLNDLMAGKA